MAGEGAYVGDFLRTETVENSPDYDNGYGFCLPTKELYDYFLPDDHVRRDAAIFTYDELVTKPNANIQDESKKSCLGDRLLRI